MSARRDPFRDFFNRAVPRLYSYFHQRLAADAEAARRLTEASMMEIVESWPLDGVTDRSGLVLDVARTHLVRELTGRRRRANDVQAPVVASGDAEGRLHEALAGLRPVERASVLLRYADGLTADETAAFVGKKARAVAAGVERALSRLADALGESEDATIARLRRLERPIIVPGAFSAALYPQVADVAATKEGRVRDDLAAEVIGGLDDAKRPWWVAVAASVGMAAALAGLVALVLSIAGGGDDGREAVVTTTETVATTVPPPTTTTVPPPIVRPVRADLPTGPPGWTALDPGPLAGATDAATWTTDELVVWTGSGIAAYNPRLDNWRELPPPPLAFSDDARLVWAPGSVYAIGHGATVARFDRAAETWTEATPGPEDFRHLVDAVWAGSELLALGHRTDEPRGADDLLAASFDPGAGTWRNLASPPVALSYADATWSGSGVYVYGGLLGPDNEPRTTDGAAGAFYDPAEESWSLLAPSQLSPNAIATARVGDGLLAFDYELNAALYEPGEGWRPAGPVPLAPLECFNRLVATPGSEVDALAWYCGDGATFDAATGAWRRIQTPRDERLHPVVTAAPIPAMGEVYFWGGGSFWVLDPDKAAPGGAVDAGGGWSLLPPAPVDGRMSVSVVSVEEPEPAVVVWGGAPGAGTASSGDGAIYSPVRDEWLFLEPAPVASDGGAAAVSTGREMIVWGGSEETRGAVLTPVAGEWRTTAAAPIDGRNAPAAVWTGAQLLVWGGRTAGAEPAPVWDGAAYDPESDAWAPIPPSPIEARLDPVAVWTGTELLLWGGHDGRAAVASGAAYDPASATWREIETVDGVPAAGAAAVWTGSRMIVVGLEDDAAAGNARLAGAYYTPGQDTWTAIAPAPFPAAMNGPEPLRAVWTGRRMAVLMPTAIEGPQVWLYDPGADAWSKSAVAPLDPVDLAMTWVEGRLFVHAVTDPVESSRTITLDLGPDGATLPPVPGTQVALDIPEPIDLRLYAFHPNPARAEGVVASVVDLAARTRTDYAPGEHTIEFTAPPDRATVLDERTVVLSIDGAVYAHDRSLYRAPEKLRDITPGRAPGLAPAVFVDADRENRRVWIFDYGSNCCSEPPRADPGIVRLVDPATGETILNTQTEPNTRPVQASGRGLLVNFEQFAPTADGFVSDPETHAYAILAPTGAFDVGGDGLAVAMTDSAIVRVLCVGLVDQECSLRVTDEASGNRPVDPPGATRWVPFTQPGTPLASPDGRWVVAAARRVNDVDANPIPVLVDVRIGSAEALTFGRFDRPGTAVAWDATGRWLVILGDEPVAYNVESQRFVQLGSILPEGLWVFAAG